MFLKLFILLLGGVIMGNNSCFEHIPSEIIELVGLESLNNLKRALAQTSVNNLHFAEAATDISFNFCFKNREKMLFINPYGCPFEHCIKILQKKHYPFYFAVFKQGPNEGTIYLVLRNKSLKNS